MQAMPSLCDVAGERFPIRSPSICNFTTVGLMRAGDDFDERGFARAILAEQRVDFTSLQIKRYAFERAHRAEGFGDG